jgi:hypothetical protein
MTAFAFARSLRRSWTRNPSAFGAGGTPPNGSSPSSGEAPPRSPRISSLRWRHGPHLQALRTKTHAQGGRRGHQRLLSALGNRLRAQRLLGGWCATLNAVNAVP